MFIFPDNLETELSLLGEEIAIWTDFFKKKKLLNLT
jgi:hypothetical protein